MSSSAFVGVHLSSRFVVGGVARVHMLLLAWCLQVKVVVSRLLSPAVVRAVFCCECGVAGGLSVFFWLFRGLWFVGKNEVLWHLLVCWCVGRAVCPRRLKKTPLLK